MVLVPMPAFHAHLLAAPQDSGLTFAAAHLCRDVAAALQRGARDLWGLRRRTRCPLADVTRARLPNRFFGRREAAADPSVVDPGCATIQILRQELLIGHESYVGGVRRHAIDVA